MIGQSLYPFVPVSWHDKETVLIKYEKWGKTYPGFQYHREESFQNPFLSFQFLKSTFKISNNGELFVMSIAIPKEKIIIIIGKGSDLVFVPRVVH